MQSSLRPLLCACGAFAATSALAAAPAYYTESPVTLQLVFRQTSQPVETGPDESGLVVKETTVESLRLGNTDLLEEMVRRSLIPSVKGHTVVAVWANWPDEKPFAGSAFRLFVRKAGLKQKALVGVPQEIFALSPEDWLHERNISRKTGVIQSGQENFEAYSRLSFGIDDRHGTLLGRDLGGGVFKSPGKSHKPQYLPKPGALSLEGSSGARLCSGEIQFGAARFIPGSDFKPGALPKKTSTGGSYGYSAVSMMATGRFGLNWYAPPPYVHYFCPLDLALTLKTQEAVPSATKGREITRITSTSFSSADLLRGLLQARGVSDPAGWAFYLHARSDEYTSLESLELVLGHPDGRIHTLGDAELDLSEARAEAARREYRDGAYIAGDIREFAHLTHDRYWTLPDGRLFRLLLTGDADIRFRYGSLPAPANSIREQPVSAELRLFGTHSNGLAEMSFSMGEPLAQSAIPAGWSSLFPPYSPTAYSPYRGWRYYF